MSSSYLNKSRLYVCLYYNGGKAKMHGLEDTYYWGLMIGPKISRGFKGPFVRGSDGMEGLLFQAKQELQPVATSTEATEVQTGESVATGTHLAAAMPSDLSWRWVVSEQHITSFLTGENQPHLLARFAMGKIVSAAMMRIAILKTPVCGDEDPEFNDVIWVREAIANVACAPRAMGTGVRLWETIRDKAMWYMEFKDRQRRWDERHRLGQTQIPTWDLMADEELVS